MYHVQGVEILQLLGVAWPQIDPNDTERDYPRRAAIVNLLVDDHTYLDVGFSLYLSYLALLVESLFPVENRAGGMALVGAVARKMLW